MHKIHFWAVASRFTDIDSSVLAQKKFPRRGCAGKEELLCFSLIESCYILEMRRVLLGVTVYFRFAILQILSSANFRDVL